MQRNPEYMNQLEVERARAKKKSKRNRWKKNRKAKDEMRKSVRDDDEDSVADSGVAISQ